MDKTRSKLTTVPIAVEILDASGRMRLEHPTNEISLTISDWEDLQPCRIVEAAKVQLGLDVAFLNMHDGLIALQCVQPAGWSPLRTRWSNAPFFAPISMEQPWHLSISVQSGPQICIQQGPLWGLEE